MILDFIIRAQTLDALFLLRYGHIEAHERIGFDRLVILLDDHAQASWQAVPLNAAFSIVLHLNLNILTIVLQVSDHKICGVNLFGLALINCEVDGAFFLRYNRIDASSNDALRNSFNRALTHLRKLLDRGQGHSIPVSRRA